MCIIMKHNNNNHRYNTNVNVTLLPAPTGKVYRKDINPEVKPRVYKPRAPWAIKLAKLPVGGSLPVPDKIVQRSMYLYAERMGYRVTVKNDHLQEAPLRCYRLA